MSSVVDKLCAAQARVPRDDRRVKVSCSLTFHGRSEEYQATAIVESFDDGTHDVEWVDLRDSRGNYWPIDWMGLEGFCLSDFEEQAIKAARENGLVEVSP